MITWMQRHKKWLVITIWISTIAFVGAGFVGWGSYKYGKQGGVIATVGDREITVDEYQQEYSNLYAQYANMFGSVFNKEVAEKLGLENIAYTQVLQKNLIMAYADSIDLDVTDEEVARELVKIEAFFKNGKFDKDIYVKVLNQNRLTPKNFEESLKRTILLQKVQSLFQVNPTSWELENIGKLLSLSDDITIKILSSKDINVTVDEDGLKKYWEDNKNSYMSEVSYDLQIKEIPFIASNATNDEIKAYYDKFKMDYKFDDGKLKSLEEAKEQIIKDLDDKFTKTEALKMYLKLKKSEEQFDKKQSFVESKLPYLQENIGKIKEAKEGEVVKPFAQDNKYFIVKIEKINSSKVLDFDEAKAKVSKDYEKSLKAKKLQEDANSQLKDFTGTDIAGVTRDSKISGLSTEESNDFLNQLFFATNKEGILNVGDKAILYKINASNLKDYDKTKEDAIKQAIIQLQETELMTNLLQKLGNSFTIKSSMQVKEK